MSKALEGVAMLGGAVLDGAVMAVLGSTGVGFAALPFLAGLMATLVTGGVAMEAGAIASALTSNRGMGITTRQPAAARQVIYGQQRVGGVEIYRSTTGSSSDQFNYVIVLAGHECDSIVNLYLDGRQVHWVVESTGNTTRNGVNFGGQCDQNTYTGPNGVQYNFGGGHGGYHVYCEARYGDQLDGDVIGGLTANDPKWAATSAGSPWVAGCTYVYLKIEYDVNVFPNEPEIRFTVNGKNNIYDPRTNSVGFTTNWALLAADVITDPVYGLGDNTVNQDQLIAAANVCDERVQCAAGMEARYTTNYKTDTTAAPGDVLAAMMTGAAGRLSRIGGEWYLWPAYWQGPAFQYDYTDLTGTPSWMPVRSYRELFNRVQGTYIAPTYPYNIAGNLYDQNGFYNGQIQNNFSFAWQSTNFPEYATDVLHGYASDEYLNEDTSAGTWNAASLIAYQQGEVVTFNGLYYQALVTNNSQQAPNVATNLWRSYPGNILPKEVSFQTVISVSQAQRVAKIMLMRNRQQGSGTFPMSLSAWAMQPCDVMEFTWDGPGGMGWLEKSLEVVGVSFQVADEQDGSQTVRCSLQVQETDASVYEWSPSPEELTPYDLPALPQQSSLIPAPPTNMQLEADASTAQVSADGITHPRIKVTWDTPLDTKVKNIQVQYADITSPLLWLDAGLVDVANNLTFIPNVVMGLAYNVRIRSVRPSGATSSWVEIDGITVGINLSIVGILSLSPGSLTASAYDDGTAEIDCSPFMAVIGNATVSVLPNGYALTGLAQQTTYWVYYIDPNFLGGNVTPIATTNTTDFENKGIGYFLIGSIVTPYCAPTVPPGPGGPTPPTSNGNRYYPTSYSDTGTVTTANPKYAYDGSLSTAAVLSGTATYVVIPEHAPSVRVSYGSCMFQGFPNYVTTADSALNVVFSTNIEQGTVINSVTAVVGSNASVNVAVVEITAATATYTLDVPSGTNLSSITVTVNVRPSAANSTQAVNSGTMSLIEIYVQ